MSCNVILGRPKFWHRKPKIDEYLANPWVDERHGVQTPMLEPSEEWIVSAGNKRFVRRVDEWHPLSHNTLPVAWRFITMTWAPWELRIDRLKAPIYMTPHEQYLEWRAVKEAKRQARLARRLAKATPAPSAA